jgi:hypothetical protein
MKRNWFRLVVKLSGIHSRAWLLVLGISAVVLVVAAWLALQNRINGDITALLPENAPSAQSLEHITQRFGATNTLILLFLAPPEEDLVDELEQASRSLSESEYIRRVDFRWAVSELEEHGLYYLDVEELERIRDAVEERIEKEYAEQNPFYVSLDDEDEEDLLDEEDFADFDTLIEEYGEGLALVGEHVYFRRPVDCSGDAGEQQCEHMLWGMILTPSRGAADVNYAKKLMEDVDRRLENVDLPESVTVYESGRYNYLATEAEFVLGDLRRVSVIGAVAVSIVVFAFFPSPFILLLIFIPLITALAIDFAIVRLTIGELNLVTTSNFAILFGMGVAYGVHIYSRFREERKRGHAYVPSMTSAVGDTGRAAFLAASTTAIAFLSLMLAEYKGFSQLGFITCIGVVFAFLAAVIIMPALGKPLSRRGLLRGHRYSGMTIDDVLKRRGAPPRGWILIVTGGVLLTVASIWLIAGFDTVYETDYNKLQFRSEQREKANRYEKLLFGWTGEPAVLAANGREDLERLVAQLRRIKEGKGRGHIQGVDSILGFVPENQEAKEEVIDEIADLIDDPKMDRAEGELKEHLERLRRLTSADPITVETLPEDIRMRFTSKDDGYLVFVYPQKDLNDIRYAVKLRELLSAEALGREYGGTSAAIIFGSIQDIMLEDAPRVIAITFLVVMIIVLVDFRSVRATLLSLVPLVLGMTWMVGLMSGFDLRVNWVNVVAFPAVIGIGVDNGVHVLHRYRMEGSASLRRIIRNLGRTLSVSTLTTMMGFGSLLLSRHPGLRSLGLLTIIGLATTFCAAVFFLPSVLYIYERFMSRRLLARPARYTVWTVAYDPSTRRLRRLLGGRDIDYKVVVVDEMPDVAARRAVAMLREKVDGPLRLPLLEHSGRTVSAGNGDIHRVRRFLDGQEDPAPSQE